MKNGELTQAFTQAFGQEPALVAYAPGRVNLIGDHTDYNLGWVLPVALDRGTFVAASRGDDSQFQVVACDLDNEKVCFSLDDLAEDQMPLDVISPWSKYVRGTVKMLSAYLAETGQSPLRGAKLMITGNLPKGAGLSSSASLEMALIKAFAGLFDLRIDGIKAAQLGQQAENDYVGCNCGIMDQLISAMGEADSAMLLDCSDLTIDQVPLPEGLRLMIINSNVKRALVTSEYNLRREQCQQVALHFGVSSLRQVSYEQLCQAEASLEPTLFRRARHVVSENARVLEMAKALNAGDSACIGRLMAASHGSLRDDFAVSTPEVDCLVALVSEVLGTDGGARMTGGGFGGCVVALLPENKIAGVRETIAAEYQARTGLTADIYLCHSGAGAFA
ncbi:galactokinase [Shewanella insulae]|uniref:galactokinase n=1 Tax=Shewanella insulae TaxID=2681496 RepID=UPI001EFEBF17|nr:galactokinase [Shewanella insulae]MCG9713598.1 galactokinase [Shewanella insulae]